MDEQGVSQPEVIRRHSLAVRLTHWINVVCLAMLLMSGLAIFNAHPLLYWGHTGHRGMPFVFGIGAKTEDGRAVGITRIAEVDFDTTGVLGVSYDGDGRALRRAFPPWLTLPSNASLALARDWHFLLAWLFVINGAVYLGFSLLSGHVRRDLLPGVKELRPRHIGGVILGHLRLRFPRGEEDRRYNVLQKLAYLAVVFGLLPVMVLSGLTMSPAVTAAAPLLFDLFGGRQSARTIHFITANLLVLFVLVHIILVLLSGAFNRLRAMVTGRYVIRPERTP
jgi:thiosulfate reductase cytochrome b subunit